MWESDPRRIDWTLTDVAEACRGVVVADAAGRITGVSTDSRATQPGDLFVALRGERFDGHDFIEQAVAAGAAAIVAEQAPAEPVSAGVVVVEDTLRAYGGVARWHRSKFDLPVVGVTGSTGKTTTKEMIAAIMGQVGPVVSTHGTENNEVGVPRALLRIESSHCVAVLELAMRGRYQLDYLARVAEPSVGVITNIGVSHVGLLGSREQIAAAKAELVAALPPEGTAVLNADDFFFDLFTDIARCPIVSFGWAEEAEVRAVSVEARGADPARYVLECENGQASIELRVAGRHNVLNSLAAAATAMRLDATLDQVAEGLRAFQGEAGRLAATVAPGGWLVLNDSYNASPDSVRAALDVLHEMPCSGRRIFALGEMLELGEAAAEEHRRVGAWVAELGIDVLLTCGAAARAAADAAREAADTGLTVEHYETRDRLSDDLGEMVESGDAVLVKGSRAVGMDAVVRRLLDDPER